MSIGVCYVKLIVVFGIVIHVFPNKTTFFAGILISFLMVNFNVFLDKTVFVRLVRTPSANTVETFLIDIRRQITDIVIETIMCLTLLLSNVSSTRWTVFSVA